MITIDNLCFPIVAIKEKKYIEFIADLNSFTTCSFKSYKRNYYNDLLIIDCLGREVTVERASKYKYLFFRHSIKVKINLNNNIKLLTLNEFKSKIINIFNTNKSFWDSGGNFNEIISIVNNELSICEIIIILNRYYNTGKFK